MALDRQQTSLEIQVKVAAYQSSLAAYRTVDALALICEQVSRCESLGVEVLCCPEGILVGLADYTDQPTTIALDIEGGQLQNADPSPRRVVGLLQPALQGRVHLLQRRQPRRRLAHAAGRQHPEAWVRR